MSATWGAAVVKILGALTVVGSGGMVGFGLARSLEGELAELERLEVALVTLSSEISYSLQPLPGALAGAGERAGGVTGALFVRMGALTGLSQRRTPAQALEQAVRDVLGDGSCHADADGGGPGVARMGEDRAAMRKGMDRGAARGGRHEGVAPGGMKAARRIPARLPAFEVGLLRDLAKNLGTSGHKEQVRYIEMSVDRLGSRRSEFAEECRKKARLYRYLGIASGASIAIVLL